MGKDSSSSSGSSKEEELLSRSILDESGNLVIETDLGLLDDEEHSLFYLLMNSLKLRKMKLLRKAALRR